MKDRDTLAQRYAEVIHVLEQNAKYLAALGMSDELIRDYKNVVGGLKRKNEIEIAALLHVMPRDIGKGGKKDVDYEMTLEEAKTLALSRLEIILSQPSTSRRMLERIAMLRFGVSRGTLSALPKAELIEKISTLVAHEGTHASIARIAGGSAELSRPGASFSEKAGEHDGVRTAVAADAPEDKMQSDDAAKPLPTDAAAAIDGFPDAVPKN